MTPFDPGDLRRLEEAEAALARSLREVEPSPALLARVQSDLESPRSWVERLEFPGWLTVAGSTAVAVALALVGTGLLTTRQPAGAVSLASPSSTVAIPSPGSLAAEPAAPGVPAVSFSPKARSASAPSLPRTVVIAAPRGEAFVPPGRAAERDAALWQLVALAAGGGTSPRALYEAGEPTRDLAEPVLPEIVPVFSLDSRSDS